MFKPFDQKPKQFLDTVFDWDELYPMPYDKMEVDPHTKCRIILMNGIHVEAIMFGHNFHRNCQDNDIRRALAVTRRGEQQEQKRINWLSPADESQLETTIGYEHVAVDLTAWLAMHEPDKYAKACLDFALLEDFDHLYRYSNLLDLDDSIPSQQLVKEYVEITPGRPTIAHHRHPMESVKRHLDFKKADIQSKLNALIITSGEQQTMNFYMNIGPTYENDPGRQLYQEIGMVEEQHVTQYGSLLDPTCSWFENLLMREYMECYLYYSFLTDEPEEDIRQIWEEHLEVEISHLHAAKDLFEKYEKRQWEEVVPAEFPELLHFKQTKDYLREILGTQVELTVNREEFVNVGELPRDHTFFQYQQQVNSDVDQVQSHVIIDDYQSVSDDGMDYRYEEAPNPVPALTDRYQDNTEVGRVAGAAAKQPPVYDDQEQEEEDDMEGMVRGSGGRQGKAGKNSSATRQKSAAGKKRRGMIQDEQDEDEVEWEEDEIEVQDMDEEDAFDDEEDYDDSMEEDMDGEFDEEVEFFEPGQISPASGTYAMVNRSGKTVGVERRIRKGDTFPPTAKSGWSYRRVQMARNKR